MVQEKINNLIITYEQAGVSLISREGQGTPLPLSTLIEKVLALSIPARLRTCLIPLFLSNPLLGETVKNLMPQISKEKARWLKIYYMAAVYLQRYWKTRLTMALGPHESLVDLFSKEMNLPDPSEYHALMGLHSLADLANQEKGGHTDFLSEFEDIVQVFMESREIKKFHH